MSHLTSVAPSFYLVSFVDSTCGAYVLEAREAEDLVRHEGVSCAWAVDRGDGAGRHSVLRALQRAQ